jgi:hypothetical protein
MRSAGHSHFLPAALSMGSRRFCPSVLAMNRRMAFLTSIYRPFVAAPASACQLTPAHSVGIESLPRSCPSAQPLRQPAAHRANHPPIAPRPDRPRVGECPAAYGLRSSCGVSQPEVACRAAAVAFPRQRNPAAAFHAGRLRPWLAAADHGLWPMLSPGRLAALPSLFFRG